jgi:CRISPR-associated protein Cas1
MIKRTLYFGNAAYLKTRNEQIVIQLAESGEEKSVPVEDTGVMILDHPQITISQALLSKLVEKNVAVISCDSTHLPIGLFMPLSGNVLQVARFQRQIEATEPLKKMLWQQTIQAKINNQAALLEQEGVSARNMRLWAKEVRSGDPDNYEARAAAYYWRYLFGSDSKFLRERHGEPPNNMLNYAYSILRGITARALSGSGLLPTLGIHHRNQYNAYCLADDIMEPYRPMADALVKEILEDDVPLMRLEPATKRRLLELPVRDVEVGGQRSPLMVAMSRTTASLVSCYERKAKKIVYPDFPA